MSSTRTGKLARLPHPIRDQVNHRLHDGEPANSILNWLNDLPEVQQILREHFSGRPIAASNLTEWKNGGYHDWCLRQDALGIVDSLADQSSLGDQVLTDGFNDKIARWTSIHIASTARTLLANETDPKARLDVLHQLNADVNRLRRNDLQAERLALERHRLHLEAEKARQLTDDEFWVWTKRPDIAKKLNPERPKGLTNARLREIEQALCLTENNFDHQIIGRLMRQRRLTHEAAAILLAQKAAELDAAERANSPHAAAAAGNGDQHSDDEDDTPDPSAARFAALCAERGLVLPPDDLIAEQSSSPAAPGSDEGGSVLGSESSSIQNPKSKIENNAEPSTPPAAATAQNSSLPTSNSQISGEAAAPPFTDSNVTDPQLPPNGCTSPPIQNRESTQAPSTSSGNACNEAVFIPSSVENRKSKIENNAPTDFCIHCYAPLPPLTESNDRPFPRCRACGRPVPEPGERSLTELPDSPPPCKPHELCPHCATALPPLLVDGTRPDNWCPGCGTSLPHPASVVEHCPFCGGRIPEFNNTVPRPKADCVHCGRILPPIPLSPSAL